MRVKLLSIATIVLLSSQLMADEVRVAAASNFANAITAIAERFEADTAHKVTLIFGSTGKHYAQIINGAPYDVFFAADAARPELLEREGVALAGSRFTYALGKLVLWSPRPNYIDPDGRILDEGDFRHLAIANPRLAPYGEAARQVLQARGLWKERDKRVVRGENISQAFQFVASGNAELGFVAWSQVKHPGKAIKGSYWSIPPSLYAPIEQQAVLLKDHQAARAFMLFVRGAQGARIIREHGYAIP
ncbi:MAG: molybdate ABC transporter substrate-binding protein [Xanthomonadales bacterium]